MNVALQPEVGSRQILDGREWQRAHLRIFKRNGVGPVAIQGDAVDSDDVPRNVVAQHLLAAITAVHCGLQRSVADRIQRVKVLSGAIDGVALLDDDPMHDQRIKLFHLVRVETNGHTYVAHAAGLTMDAASAEGNDLGSGSSAVEALDGRIGRCGKTCVNFAKSDMQGASLSRATATLAPHQGAEMPLVIPVKVSRRATAAGCRTRHSLRCR